VLLKLHSCIYRMLVRRFLEKGNRDPKLPYTWTGFLWDSRESPMDPRKLSEMGRTLFYVLAAVLGGCLFWLVLTEQLPTVRWLNEWQAGSIGQGRTGGHYSPKLTFLLHLPLLLLAIAGAYYGAVLHDYLTSQGAFELKRQRGRFATLAQDDELAPANRQDAMFAPEQDDVPPTSPQSQSPPRQPSGFGRAQLECPKCKIVFSRDPGESAPPWCPRCGGDLRSSEPKAPAN
jgi:hypothetical protein